MKNQFLVKKLILVKKLFFSEKVDFHENPPPKPMLNVMKYQHFHHLAKIHDSHCFLHFTKKSSNYDFYIKFHKIDKFQNFMQK